MHLRVFNFLVCALLVPIGMELMEVARSSKLNVLLGWTGWIGS